MKFSIGKKLTVAFSSVISVFVVASSLNYLMVEDTIDIQHRVTGLRFKTAGLGKDIETGIQASLAGLRGYMILGADPAKAQAMKTARKQAWQLIDQSLSDFKSLSKHWTDPNNIKRLNNLVSVLGEFKSAQQQVEQISHTAENISSYNILLTEAAPKAGKMLTSLNALIDEEEKLEATTERKQLLKYLADSRGSFAVALANIRAFLLSGNSSFSQNFEAKWTINQQRVKDVQQLQSLFTPSQLKQWKRYLELREQFTPIPQKMFADRLSKEWNKANFLLGTKAAPKAREALKILAEMRNSQEQLLLSDILLLNEKNNTLKTTLISVLLITIIIGVIAATLLSRNILSRLKPVVDRAKAIAENDMSGKPMLEKGDDEITQLTHSMNSMSLVLSSLVKKTADSMSDVAQGAKTISKAN